MLLARCVRHRREELGLSIERAAELSGMEVSTGMPWRPAGSQTSNPGCWSAIAGTLEACSYPVVLYRRSQPL